MVRIIANCILIQPSTDKNRVKSEISKDQFYPESPLLYKAMKCMDDLKWCAPSITDGVHRNEKFMEIIPVFSTFSNFFKLFQKKKKKKLKAILCNFSMRLLKYFLKLKNFDPQNMKNPP